LRSPNPALAFYGYLTQKASPNLVEYVSESPMEGKQLFLMGIYKWEKWLLVASWKPKSAAVNRPHPSVHSSGDDDEPLNEVDKVAREIIGEAGDVSL
tara:strand:- start:27 stop:317 length:291 start_codon:yes stop_codon:yes gene_type:complete